jgi:hypothetical protein
MEFEEAKKYLDANLKVIGQYISENKPHKIKSLYVAPKLKSPEERQKVLSLIYSGEDNYAALAKLNWLNENHDVYFYATVGNEGFSGLLYDFLSKPKTL